MLWVPFPRRWLDSFLLEPRHTRPMPQPTHRLCLKCSAQLRGLGKRQGSVHAHLLSETFPGPPPKRRLSSSQPFVACLPKLLCDPADSTIARWCTCISLLPSVGHNRFAPVAPIKGRASKLGTPLERFPLPSLPRYFTPQISRLQLVLRFTLSERASRVRQPW